MNTDRILVKFTVCTDVEETAGGIVGPGTKRISIWEELDSIDVRFVASEGLNGLAGANIPEFGEGIAGAGDENVLIGRIDANAHDISEVVGEFSDLGPSLDIPEHASHIARRGQNAAVIDEAATGKVARMTG